MNPLVSTLLEGAWVGLAVAGAMAIVLPWLGRDSKLRPIPIIIAIAMTVRYLYWRITETVPPTNELEDIIAGVIFLAIELFCASGMILSFLVLTRTRNRTPEVEANKGWLMRAGSAAARRRLHLHLQRRGGNPRTNHHRRNVDGLSELPRLGAR